MIIREYADRFDVQKMCEVLEASRSGYYAWCTRPVSPRKREDDRLTELIKEIHKEKKVYGSPRMFVELRRSGERCGRNKVARLMRQARIRAEYKKKFRVTTDSRHHLPVALNLLNRDFTATALNQKWCSDISYIWTDEGWLYLGATLDLFNRKIIGWSMNERMPRKLVCDSLEMAIRRNRPCAAGLIHHSDRGRQYCSDDFQAMLKDNEIACSMSRKGNCWDNAPMESFFHTLKTELVYRKRFRTRAQARREIFEYIEVFYNRQRLHSTLGYCTPEEFEAKAHCA